MAWIVIAIRNLFKNGRRSFFTIVAIMLGFAAIVLFDGYINYMFTNLQESIIYGRGNGHLTVFKKGFLQEGKLHPERYLINKDELHTLNMIFEGHEKILLASPELNINGLVSNGAISTIFFATGRIPSKRKQILSHATSLLSTGKYFKGMPLSDGDLNGIGLGESLSRMLGVNVGDAGVIVISPTIDGAMNALDATTKQTVYAGNEELEDKFLVVTLKFAQTLYDIDSVDRVRVLLDGELEIGRVKDYLQSAFDKQGLGLEIKEWTELAPFYIKAKKMFKFIFIFVFIIVLTVSVMSVINTLGMSIMERTREIGTMRAMGLKRLGVIRLFVIESSVLVSVGATFGLLIAECTQWLIDVFEVHWTPPQVSVSVPLEIHLDYNHMLIVFISLQVIATIAAVLPAKRAAFTSIVDALRHV